MADTPPGAASRPTTSSAATVTDHRPVPRGVLPRGVQTWMMAGLALGMLAIMLIVGRPDPPPRPAAAPVQPASADRVRDYQDRLRVLEAQALRDSQSTALPPGTAPGADDRPQPAVPQDPTATDRRRREYESRFASNVVMSRRPDTERPDVGRPASPSAAPSRSDPANPSMDEVADAVVRATTRTGVLAAGGAASLSPPAVPNQGTSVPPRPNAPRTAERTDAISAAGPLHRVLEGTVIDTVVTNRLDGTSAAPVNCLVTNPL